MSGICPCFFVSPQEEGRFLRLGQDCCGLGERGWPGATIGLRPSRCGVSSGPQPLDMYIISQGKDASLTHVSCSIVVQQLLKIHELEGG